MQRIILTALCFVYAVADNVETFRSSELIVTTRSGIVKGIYLKSELLNREFRGFLSIPYAEPPLGPLRFTPPNPVAPWSGVFTANRTNVQCVQFYPTRSIDTEDCLVLNVYTPKKYVAHGKLLPVAVVIHGGAFVQGSGSYEHIKPELFLDHDIVMVTFNYRLGILGFLNTEDEASPGNYGMLDQVLALKWVRNNIYKFGGDPQLVTLIGNSAGGASAMYHTLSPLSKGLFSAVIDQSGSPHSPWAFIRHPINWARKAAGLTGCTQQSTSDLVACLRTKTDDEIFIGRQKELKIGLLFNVGPSIDVEYGEGFLPDDPATLIKTGKIEKVPMLVGFAHDDGAPFINVVNAIRQTSGQTFLNTEFCFFLTTVLDVAITPTVANECRLIVQEYFGNVDVNNTAVLQAGLIQVFGDSLLIGGSSQTFNLLASAGVKFQAYDFDYHLDITDTVKSPYSSHGDELNLLFHQNYYGQVIPFTPENQRMSKILVSIWTNFVKERKHYEEISPPGEQSFNWPLYDTENRNILSLNLNSQPKTGLIPGRPAFWEAHLPIILGA